MESTPSELAEGAAVIKVLAAVLERLVSANGKIAEMDPGVITRFHALKPPSISVLSYLQRIHKYASCSTECFILALIYIDRLIQRNNFLLTELNVHRVVITSIMLAAKFFDDQYFNNAYYAKVGGVPATEMNSLEVEFLFRINFSLHVTPELYNKYHSELVTHAVAADGKLPPSPNDVALVPPSPPMPPQQHPPVQGGNLMGVEGGAWTSAPGVGSFQSHQPIESQQQQQQQQFHQQQQQFYQQPSKPMNNFPAHPHPNPFANPNIPCMQAPFQQNGRVSGAVA
mmetsp:Transcript_15003/g.30901  ORF Transcript_15003/g.30901 Transcript_15003/m.30901 type:complete len:284 (-) Transcript_15003:465-1316(-)